MENNEIILYQPEETIKIEVRLENETVWLNRQQIAILFARYVKTIGKHIANALKEELTGIPVVAKIATTATDGKTYMVEYYNLDLILSIGYRVKSQQGVLFRQWANRASITDSAPAWAVLPLSWLACPRRWFYVVRLWFIR